MDVICKLKTCFYVPRTLQHSSKILLPSVFLKCRTEKLDKTRKFHLSAFFFLIFQLFRSVFGYEADGSRILQFRPELHIIISVRSWNFKVLKSQLFGQESTCHQGKIFKKFLRVMTVRQKVPKSYFQSQFWMSKIN